MGQSALDFSIVVHKNESVCLFSGGLKPTHLPLLLFALPGTDFFRGLAAFQFFADPKVAVYEPSLHASSVWH